VRPGVEAPAMAGEQVRVVGGASSAGQAALHLARFAGRGHAAHTGELLAASVSGYLITQLKATPSIGVRFPAPELPAAMAKAAWKP
jgi:thioredoxin reductase (NADPH)